LSKATRLSDWRSARRLLVDVCRSPTFFRETGLSVLVLARIVERGAIALQLGLSALERNAIVGRFDFEQHVALMHVLIIRDWQLDDSSRHLGRYRDDIGPHCAIAGPGRGHINLPRAKDEQGRHCDRTKRDQYWSDVQM
jgi:hypothetical protein